MNPEHLSILKSGVSKWNEWRENNPREKPDFSGANLSKMDLAGVDFFQAILDGANFQSTNLEKARLREAHAAGANFTRAVLNDCKCHDLIAPKAIFDFCDAIGANFHGAILQKAHFENSACSRADFTIANLEGADFSHADLQYSTLTSANIRETDLTYAQLEHAHFNLYKNSLREYLGRARNHLLASYDINVLRQLGLPENHRENVHGNPITGKTRLCFNGYDLRGIDLSGDDLTGVDFTNAKLTGANLSNATLKWADLRGALCDQVDFAGANLSSTKLQNTKFSGADLKSATLDFANMQGSILIGASLDVEVLKRATNYLLAIYDPEFAVEELKLPRNHHTMFVKQKIDAKEMGGALIGATLVDADLSGWDVCGVSFAGTNAAGLVCQNIRAMGSDWTGANLSGFVGHGGNFLGAKMHRANLIHGKARGVIGINRENIAGANLEDSELPVSRGDEEALKALQEFSRHAWLCIGAVQGFVLTALLIALSASDRSLVAPEGLFRMPAVPVIVPGRFFFWSAPLLALLASLYLHLMLQTIWDEAARLPAKFPSGAPAHINISPYLLNGMVRSYLVWREERSPRRTVQEFVSIGVLYGSTIVFQVACWLRYLDCRDWPVTFLHLTLIAINTTFAVAFYRLAQLTLESSRLNFFGWTLTSLFSGIPARSRIAIAVVTLFMFFFSWIMIEGAPTSPPVSKLTNRVSFDPRTWLPGVLWTVGIDVRLTLRDDVLSVSPSRSNGQGRIAYLSGRDLRFADATRCKFEAAVLSRSRLDFATFTDSILENADLSGASLESADFKGANLRHSDFTGSNIKNTDFTGADLTGAIGIERLTERGAIRNAPEPKP